jgi:hypothetical protein
VNKAESFDKELESKIEKEVDDWMEKVIEDLEKGEQEAKQLYERWMTVSDDKSKWSETAILELRQADNEIELAKSRRVPGGSPWADIFPSWSTEGQNRGHEPSNHQHKFKTEVQNQPPHRPAEDVDETIDKLHKDLGRWLGDADQWRQRFQKGFERDSRLWQDEGLFGPSIPFSKPLSTLFSLSMRPFLPEQSAMGYLLYSEYSPLHLEHEEGFDSSFRQRFEDLLRAEDGKAMLSKDECKPANQTSSVDWLGRLIPLLKDGENGGPGQITIGSDWSNSSVLQVQERQTPFDNSRHTRESDDGPGTEQDMYKQHFSHFPREPLEVAFTSRSILQEPEIQSSRPSILSILTTTERLVASDGSVTTKTVLKKRFADGREESSETIENTPATRPTWREQRSELGANFEIARRKPALSDEPEKKGWFWSS